MIKLILNGSFRSGTTVLWKTLRESNPETYCFCEPLHSDLFSEIAKEQRVSHSNQGYPLGYPTKSEFMGQGDEFVGILRRLHPLIGDRVYSFQIDAVVRYLRAFSSLDRPVILQPNRMHFILSDVAEEFNCNVAHIIRHPMDVFFSVLFSSPKLKFFRKKLGLAPYLIKYLKDRNPYNLHEQCGFVSQYFGISVGASTGFKKLISPRMFFLERFLLAWTISNREAVAGIDAAGGVVIRYEDCVSGEGLQKLAEYSGLCVDRSKVKLHRESISTYSAIELSDCFAIVERMGIGADFDYLMKRFSYVE